jgi:hypothetical protein
VRISASIAASDVTFAFLIPTAAISPPNGPTPCVLPQTSRLLEMIVAFEFAGAGLLPCDQAPASTL